MTRHVSLLIHSFYSRYASLTASGSDLWTWQQKNPKGYNPNKENKWEVTDTNTDATRQKQEWTVK